MTSFIAVAASFLIGALSPSTIMDDVPGDATLKEVVEGGGAVTSTLSSNDVNGIVRAYDNTNISVRIAKKQDILPYPTNEIPASVIVDAPWLTQHQSLQPATNYTDSAMQLERERADKAYLFNSEATNLVKSTAITNGGAIAYTDDSIYNATSVLKKVAYSGSYLDLDDKPEIPSTNGFVTASVTNGLCSIEKAQEMTNGVPSIISNAFPIVTNAYTKGETDSHKWPISSITNRTGATISAKDIGAIPVSVNDDTQLLAAKKFEVIMGTTNGAVDIHALDASGIKITQGSSPNRTLVDIGSGVDFFNFKDNASISKAIASMQNVFVIHSHGSSTRTYDESIDDICKAIDECNKAIFLYDSNKATWFVLSQVNSSGNCYFYSQKLTSTTPPSFYAIQFRYYYDPDDSSQNYFTYSSFIERKGICMSGTPTANNVPAFINANNYMVKDTGIAYTDIAVKSDVSTAKSEAISEAVVTSATNTTNLYDNLVKPYIGVQKKIEDGAYAIEAAGNVKRPIYERVGNFVPTNESFVVTSQPEYIPLSGSWGSCWVRYGGDNCMAYPDDDSLPANTTNITYYLQTAPSVRFDLFREMTIVATNTVFELDGAYVYGDSYTKKTDSEGNIYEKVVTSSSFSGKTPYGGSLTMAKYSDSEWRGVGDGYNFFLKFDNGYWKFGFVGEDAGYYSLQGLMPDVIVLKHMTSSTAAKLTFVKTEESTWNIVDSFARKSENVTKLWREDGAGYIKGNGDVIGQTYEGRWYGTYNTVEYEFLPSTTENMKWVCESFVGGTTATLEYQGDDIWFLEAPPVRRQVIGSADATYLDISPLFIFNKRQVLVTKKINELATLDKLTPLAGKEFDLSSQEGITNAISEIIRSLGGTVR